MWSLSSKHRFSINICQLTSHDRKKVIIMQYLEMGTEKSRDNGSWSSKGEDLRKCRYVKQDDMERKYWKLIWFGI
jgi:hypothetical protein